MPTMTIPMTEGNRGTLMSPHADLMTKGNNVRLIAAACRQIDAAATLPSLDDLARAAGLSPHHFHRVFKAVTGVTPKAYAAQRRTERVRAALTRGEPVTSALYDAGYESAAPFYAEAPATLGMAPRAYRRGGEAETIRFAVGQARLGAILVAATDVGVCAILLGDDPEVLLHELQDAFPRAELVGADQGFEALVAQVVGFVDQPTPRLDLPLDVRGTAFQRRVWEALRALPPGATATYTQIAERIGSRTASRAVARACAANRLAVAIPCHRVIRADGSLSGYRWGVARKRALLATEAGAQRDGPLT